MRGRITRIFVQARAGRGGEVRAGLERLAAARLNVEPADFDATLFAQAAEPINQSTETFAAICALVGFMFAYCAMLLTTPLREGLIRSLRRNGATRLETVKTLLFDALVLGRPGLARRAGARRGDLAHRFPCRCRLSVVRIPDRLAADRDLAERRDRRGRRSARGLRGCADTRAGDLLAPLGVMSPVLPSACSVAGRSPGSGRRGGVSRDRRRSSCSRRPSRRSSASRA